KKSEVSVASRLALAGVLRSSNFFNGMSALGQKQTLRSVRPMSALPPKVDIGTQSWNVRFVPKADIPRCGKKREIGGGARSATALVRIELIHSPCSPLPRFLGNALVGLLRPNSLATPTPSEVGRRSLQKLRHSDLP